MHHPLYSVTQIRAIEHAALASLPSGALMQRAGAAAAQWALELISEVLPVLVLAGPGNNGGDALEVAANLRDAGVAVTVLHRAGATQSSGTAAALERCQMEGVTFVDAVPAGVPWALVVDGLFGIGVTRAITLALPPFTCPVLALDVPSGLDGDTGTVVDGAVRASHTITFIGDKPGLHTGDGRDYAGIVRVASLDIDPALLPVPDAELVTPAAFGAQLAPRRQNSHKGEFGDVAIIGGADGMAGAAILAARAALYSGAGRVFVAALDTRLSLDAMHPEIMFRAAASFALAGRTLVVGPGMGDGARGLLARAIASDSPLVLDADALNALAAEPGLQDAVRTRTRMAILTPHPLEAARLLGVTAKVVQADRLAAARELAARCGAVVVLKGSGTVIAQPDGRIAINPTGNAGLATGGAGDVLSGLSGTLLAQGWDAWPAALGAVWIHGAAADRLVGQGSGPIGLTAGELPAAIRAVLNSLV
ncbi:NAD(P)H-hydrate dehydratase [Massilia sp. S19_KUP03_FR1]|uniref:NAD(P)H-hydrate dehydratase n=1 Tax=Massilia sp. S19_KUP03_FR1 TaxID=3025503 RepID=UPI002FCD7BA8